MTESLKLSEIHRTNIEYERQRHLANWLIKSSPHMAKPSTPPSKSQQQKLNTKNGTITQNAIFFLQKPNVNNLAVSRTPLFNSQTNLPLQIVTSQEGHKPKLRRFNSHDTSANMFSVADFENARLARRNEMELKQRQQQNRYKMNSLSSGGDCSTGDSKGSKFSSESHTELLPADMFLERCPLPRVVRISSQFGDETIQSSSSNGSGSSASAKKDTKAKQNGELCLLFRHLKNRKIYHGVSTKNGSARKKGVMIPQEFPGYFSTLNDKNGTAATMYTTLVQLVRERVYKFLSVDSLQVYTETQNTDNFPPRPHYVKGTARGGHIFRLLAVFEDGKQDSSALSSSATKMNGNSFREKEKGRYAQLLDENRHIVYVSLTTKGKFYEIEQTTPHILQKNHSDGAAVQAVGSAQKQFNNDCVHRINTIITPETELPITIRYVSGAQVNGSNGIPELLVINRVTTENVVIACSIEESESRQPLHLHKIPVTQDMRFIKCFLGFENEQKMFSNLSIQNVLKFCQINFDNFTKLVEFEQLATNVKSLTLNGSGKPKTEGLKILKPLHFPRLLRREKSMIAHEKEDSIIFLSKNDLENMENKEAQKRESVGSSSNSKMKVFQSTKKKWFRNSKSTDKSESFGSAEMDIQSKRMSLDRYQDMSKLLIERFGGNAGLDAKDVSTRPNSEIGVDHRREIDSSELRQKSMSLQDMDTRSEQSEMSANKPDLVNIEFESASTSYDQRHHKSQQPGPSSTDANDNEPGTSLMSLSNHQQSFISPKMYTEFHVKTKQHSKSSSSLHQLLHFAVPQKMNINETKKQSADSASNSNRISFVEDNSYDDLPYSNVRDSLVMSEPDETVQQNGNHHHHHNENIYSEICSDSIGPASGATSGAAGREHGSSIRISVSSGRDRDTGSSSKMSGCSGVSRDNIYNTLN
ncbi:uncharacterized protein LOC119070679 isoform X1 [Bradysia coprophila]|uniref:uncharacterized protein LOC119070679 isoform X1 n=1 Tax=Bradysia coprophila TaxID=38358 RepID=UPI00187D8A67|nr:uncharacterized protein LOC119070679 isoform X1 [Bradysia coprophila]XP_037031016.1 uncharacterized protein LOC119070679 isoform X1 [Bradysia coprophila]XP_037031017.1 uncharacterized protein LOC119070679 isoform X1 [Bradysia coprophila]XP_037031018.1 uncharacterized protein LOC119070679 isoform X1 [Bradysia coprophila]XP_037031019.1 uncharacterized protein LOC119070679 isoform X1 [Bradysia coprophila]